MVALYPDLKTFNGKALVGDSNVTNKRANIGETSVFIYLVVSTLTQL